MAKAASFLSAKLACSRPKLSCCLQMGASCSCLQTDTCFLVLKCMTRTRTLHRRATARSRHRDPRPATQRRRQNPSNPPALQTLTLVMVMEAAHLVLTKHSSQKRSWTVPLTSSLKSRTVGWSASRVQQRTELTKWSQSDIRIQRNKSSTCG